MIPVQTGTQCAGRSSLPSVRTGPQGSAASSVPTHRRGEGRTLPAVTYSAGRGRKSAPAVHLRLANLPFTSCGEHLVAQVSTTRFRDDGVTCPGCRAHIAKWPANHFTQADGLIAGPSLAVCGAGPIEWATGVERLTDCPDCLRWLEERGGARG